MRQRWWIAVVAVVGIGLAILLFPRPDTGEDIPAANPDNASPLDFGNDAPPRRDRGDGLTARAPGAEGATTARPELDPRLRGGPKPGTEALMEKRNRPEVVYASKLVTPFSAIRYTLMRLKDDPAALALAEEVGAVSNSELRTIRLDPDTVTWDELEAKMQPAIDKVTASSYASDPTIAKALERYKQFVAEYHDAKANAPKPGEAEGVPGVDGPEKTPAAPGEGETP